MTIGSRYPAMPWTPTCSMTRSGSRTVARISAPARMISRPPQKGRLRRQWRQAAITPPASAGVGVEAQAEPRQRERGGGRREVVLAQVVDGHGLRLLREVA